MTTTTTSHSGGPHDMTSEEYLEDKGTMQLSLTDGQVECLMTLVSKYMPKHIQSIKEDFRHEVNALSINSDSYMSEVNLLHDNFDVLVRQAKSVQELFVHDG